MVKFGARPFMRFVPCLAFLFNVAMHDIQGFGLVPESRPVACGLLRSHLCGPLAVRAARLDKEGKKQVSRGVTGGT